MTLVPGQLVRQLRLGFGHQSQRVPAGLLLLSENLRVLSANRAFLESFRLREEDVLGRDLQQLVRAEPLVRSARQVEPSAAGTMVSLLVPVKYLTPR